MDPDGKRGQAGDRKDPQPRAFLSMRARGLEPPRGLIHKALNLARLPIPPRALEAATIAAGRVPSGGGVSFEHMFDTPIRTDPEGVAEVDLTKRQQEIFAFIKRYSDENGYPPTVRDIGKAVGLASSSTVHAHLANLEKLGLVRRDPTKPRALELLDRAGSGMRNLVGQAGAGLPLIGQVAAGTPLLAEENIEEYVPTPQVAGGEDGEYLLRIRGESMKDAGILNGDLVVVRRQDSARDGEIVVALVGAEAEATVKRFFQEDDHIRLQPENDSMEPIRSREVTVIGRVVGLMRSM